MGSYSVDFDGLIGNYYIKWISKFDNKTNIYIDEFTIKGGTNDR